MEIRKAGRVVCLTLVTCFCALPSAAQQLQDTRDVVLKLFLDCQGAGCRDLDFFRSEVPVVNWVRDREDSDLHVLVTDQTTGGGGRLFTLAFIGRGEFEGEEQELSISTSADATDDDQRTAILGRLKLGLVQYLVGTPAADQIVVSLLGAQGVEAEMVEQGGRAIPREEQVASSGDDPWNFWVFRLGGNGVLNGESRIKASNLIANLSANRTTDAWKFDISGLFSKSKSEFTVNPDLPQVVSVIEDWRLSSILVRSLTPKWSLGVRTISGRSTRLNEDFRWSISPGIEYNFVPYSESTRRLFTLQALLNVRHWDYTEETVYFETEETRLAASLTAAVNQVQPWGRMQLSLTGSQYLHDADLYRVALNGSLSFRLFRGFSVNVGGFYAWVRDQLFLPTGGASQEDVLLRQRQLQTNFNYATVVGFSYQFGSIFNNVVNPRFGGGGGDRIEINIRGD